MGPKRRSWAGITTSKTNCVSPFRPSASRPWWCHHSEREKPSKSGAWRMAPEEACAGDMLVLIRWQSRNLAAPLSQLVATDADEPTIEAIGDWHYWVAQGYGF